MTTRSPACRPKPLTPGQFGGLLGSALLEPLPAKLRPGFLVFSKPGAAEPLARGLTAGTKRSTRGFKTNCGSVKLISPQLHLSLLNSSCESWKQCIMYLSL